MVQEVFIKKFTVLEDLKYDFSNHHVLVTGKNAIGKSSLLKFIRIALGEECVAPGSEGSGEVYINKEGKSYHLKVAIKDGKSKVTVTGEDGMSDSKKGTLANIIGAINFNIHEFVELSKSEKGRKQQVEIFKSFFPADIIEGIRKMEANVKAREEDRTQLNRDIKQKEAEVKSNPLGHLLDKELDAFKSVDISATMEDMKTIQASNKKVQDIMDRMTTRSADIDGQRIKLIELMNQVKEMEATIKSNTELQDGAQTYLDQPANKIHDTGKYEEIIKNATKTNEDFNNAQKLKSDNELLAKMVGESQDATVNIESQREAIKRSIKDMSTDMVPGLTFDENGLIYNDLPVHPDTHSTSERIKLGMRIKIAENKELGTLFLENLESVDEDGIKAIIEIADEEGMQVIGEEVVRKQDKMEFIIIGK